MPFAVPTLSTLVDRISGDLNARMGNPNALIKRSLAWVLARVLAGAAWGLYQYQAWVADQIIPDTAEGSYLERWARIWGISRTAANKAAGKVVVTAVAGASVSDGDVLQRSDRTEYVVTGGPYSWSVSGNQNVNVEGVEAGEAGNYPFSADASLEFVSPGAGVVAEAAVHADGITAGTDTETDESLLERVLQRLQNPPQGGSAADYEAWAQAALSTVERVWVFGPPDLPDGEVKVYFTVTGTGTGIIPTSGAPTTDVGIVNSYITNTARKPVAAEVSANAPTGHPVTLTIGLTPEAGADPVDVKAAILAELESMFADRADVTVSGTDIPNSYLLEAIGAAEGVDSFTLTAVDGGAGTDPVSLAAYEYPTVVAGGITWS